VVASTASRLGDSLAVASTPSRRGGSLAGLRKTPSPRMEDTEYKPRVAAPVSLIQVVTMLHRVQHQHLSLQIVVTFGRDNIFVDLDLDVRPDRQP